MISVTANLDELIFEQATQLILNGDFKHFISMLDANDTLI